MKSEFDTLYLKDITKEMIESQGYIYDDMSPVVIGMEVINKSDKDSIRMIIKDKSGKEKNIDGPDKITNFIDEIKSKYKQQRYDKTYLKMATEWGKLSHCSRKQVGALIVKNGDNGKWYLKGKDKSLEYLRGKLDEKIGRARNGVFCLLLE